MVNAGTVLRDSNEILQVGADYMEQIEDLSTSWKGASYDSLSAQGTDFHAKMLGVSKQLNQFASAVKAYESYENAKSEIERYYSRRESTEDEALIAEYNRSISYWEAKKQEYSAKVKTALANAATFNMDGTRTRTVSTTGGTFVADTNGGTAYGHIESSIDGKTHTIYNQMNVGWPGDCNRAAAASIASAFAKDVMQPVNVAKGCSNGIGYNSAVTNQYFSNFGLTANVNKINGKYDTVKDDIVKTLSNGDYVMFDLSDPGVRGASGQTWSGTRHWLALLDIKKTDNGYAVFVSDSGHGGSVADRSGLGAGWYSIDEFSGKNIESYTTVSTIKP